MPVRQKITDVSAVRRGPHYLGFEIMRQFGRIIGWDFLLMSKFHGNLRSKQTQQLCR
jgi:hypothetical protein